MPEMAPKYLVIFYPVSAGQNGPLLGTDEEEIVLLVFIIIDVVSNQIVAEKRYVVKPRTADINENVLSDQCRNEFGLSEDQVKRGELLETVIEQFHEWVQRFLSSPSRSGRESSGMPPPGGGLKLDDSGVDIGSAPCSLSSSLSSTSSRYGAWVGPNVILVCDGQLPLRQCFHPEACNKNIDVPPYYYSFFDLRKEFRKAYTCEEINAVGDMLTVLGKEPIVLPGDQATAEAENMALVVRSMLEKGYNFAEPEDINVRLEPGICTKNEVVDNNCVVRARGLPWQSSDQDIARFFRGLNVAKGGVALCLSQQGRRNGEALCRFVSQEHRDMALKRHKHHMGSRYIEVYRASGEDFINVAGGNNNEAQAFLSRNGQVIVRMRGLPYDCTAKQVVEFFSGVASAKKDTKPKEEPLEGTGDESEPPATENGSGSSSSSSASGSHDSDSGRGDSQDEDQDHHGYAATATATAGTASPTLSPTDPNACHVMDGEGGVLFVKKADGRATGDAFVMFATEEDGAKALAKHRQSIGSRYIELFRSTTAEVQQILNRPVDSRPLDQQAQVAAAVAAAQPALAVPPVSQLPLLPQQIITAGIRKDCIRLRGLPYEAQVEHILEFLGEHAKCIAYRGVHMIYNAQQQPSGEAFIQMDSERSAFLAASQKHHKNMSFGKKQRYIEVFQCSGQDMQLVLSGGVPQSQAGPAAGTGPALLSPGMLPHQTMSASRVASPVPVSSSLPSMSMSMSMPMPSSPLLSQSVRAGAGAASLDQFVRGGAAGAGGPVGSAAYAQQQAQSGANAAAAAAASMLFCLPPSQANVLSRQGPGGYPTGVSVGAGTLTTQTVSPSHMQFSPLLMRPPHQMLLASPAAAAAAAQQSLQSLQSGKRSFDQAFFNQSVAAAADQGSLAKRHQPWSVAAAHAAAAAQQQSPLAQHAMSAGWPGQPSAAATAAAVAQAQAAAAGLGLSLGVHGLQSHVLAYPQSHSNGLY